MTTTLIVMNCRNDMSFIYEETPTGFCPGVSVHKGIATVFSLIRMYWLCSILFGLFYGLLCTGT